MHRVDFVVNCFERTYRHLLQPGRLDDLVGAQQFEFAERTLLINNVDDFAHIRRLADAGLTRGEITRAVVVADHLDTALAQTRLSRRDLRRLPHYSDCGLVAVALDGADWFVYWDADARLKKPHDWITPTMSYMEHHREIAIGNPCWWREGEAEREAIRIGESFAVGYGFSDVAFLARRSELGRAIYRYFAPASWRFPLAAVEPIFEQRVDAYMRRCGRLRATYLPAVYEHVSAEGEGYPSHGLRERVRLRAQGNVGALLARVTAHPAVRV
jgi:hypothetical protein